MTEPTIIKRGRGRPPKIIEPAPDQLIDTSSMSQSEIIQQLRNKIFTLAMLPDPASQILVLATKVFGVDQQASTDTAEQLTEQEIRDRLEKLL